ncbi:helix-turn-helix domain-containing protein [Rhizobium sp. T136]|uniref:helix-turn-helix domain-containing protein n=1 Tax=Rhizobium sp. T136 TaxID=555319 RepID=UPI003FA75415
MASVPSQDQECWLPQDEEHVMTVFTPARLAERWECSERHVRNLISSGQLRCFRLGGKLIRIKEEDVERFEECQSGDLQGSMENFASPGMTRTESADVIDLGQQTRKRRPAAPRLDTRN